MATEPRTWRPWPGTAHTTPENAGMGDRIIVSGIDGKPINFDDEATIQDRIDAAEELTGGVVLEHRPEPLSIEWVVNREEADSTVGAWKGAGWTFD